MAKQTVIDWQKDSLLVAVGQSGANTLEQVSWQPIGAAEGAEQQNGNATQALYRAAEALGIRKTDATVVISREIVEVRTIQIPRIEPQELPDVIRFQAQRQLANMGDQWLLDYVLLPDEPGAEMLTALVGVVAPAAMAEIESACSEAGISLTHVALRPIEIARFAINSRKLTADGISVVVCLSQHQADLLILKNGQVVQVRATKMPSNASEVATCLGGEIRRSLMAASPQLAGKSVTSAVLIACPDLASQAHGLLSELLDCEVAVVDPSSGLPKQQAGETQLANQAAARIVAVVGSLGFAAADQKHKLDFKNPKKRPPPKSKKTTYLLAAAAAAVLVLGGVTWWVSTNRDLDDQLAYYRSEIANKKDLKLISEQRIAELGEIDSFLRSSPNWLEELTYISERMPPAEKIRLGEPAFSTIPFDGSGQIRIPVAYDRRETLSAFEKAISDENHTVKSSEIKQLDPPSQHYYWTAIVTISIRGRGWKLVDELDAGRPVVGPMTAESSAAEEPVVEDPAAESNEDAATPADQQPAESPAVPTPDENKQAQTDSAGDPLPIGHATSTATGRD